MTVQPAKREAGVLGRRFSVARWQKRLQNRRKMNGNEWSDGCFSREGIVSGYSNRSERKREIGVKPTTEPNRLPERLPYSGIRHLTSRCSEQKCFLGANHPG
jgi:hypothetical protein